MPGAAGGAAKSPGPAGNVVHLLTEQPTEVIHRCGDRPCGNSRLPKIRQPGRSDRGGPHELHACKLLTMWITHVENFRLRPHQFGGSGFGVDPGARTPGLGPGKWPCPPNTRNGTGVAEGAAGSRTGELNRRLNRLLNTTPGRLLPPDAGNSRDQLETAAGAVRRRRRPSGRPTRQSPGPGRRRGRLPAPESAGGRGGCRQ